MRTRRPAGLSEIAVLAAQSIVHSTINVATGRGQPTVPELAELLEDNPPTDRDDTVGWVAVQGA